MSETTIMIEVTAGELTAELARRGFSPDERVRVTIEPEDERFPGRREARSRVVAAGWSDEDIDRMVKEAQQEVEPATYTRHGRESGHPRHSSRAIPLNIGVIS
jgi:hypothetical protein